MAVELSEPGVQPGKVEALQVQLDRWRGALRRAQNDVENAERRANFCLKQINEIKRLMYEEATAQAIR